MERDASALLYAVDFRECTTLASLGPEALGDVFVKALRHAGATVLHKLIHVFPGSGLTCVLILSESHAALHTWPETGVVHVDIFSCSCRLKSLEAIDDLSRSLGACHVSVQEVRRVNGHRPQPDARP